MLIRFPDPEYADTFRAYVNYFEDLAGTIGGLYIANRVCCQQASDNLLAQFSAAQIVRELTGLEPPPGNVEMLARDLLSRKFDARMEDHALPAELLLENYHRGRDLAATLNLEFWYATDEFLLGDLPAVSYDRDADAVGILNGVPGETRTHYSCHSDHTTR